MTWAPQPRNDCIHPCRAASAHAQGLWTTQGGVSCGVSAWPGWGCTDPPTGASAVALVPGPRQGGIGPRTGAPGMSAAASTRVPRHCEERLSTISFPSGLFHLWQVFERGIGMLFCFMSSSALRWVCGQVADSPHPASVSSLDLLKTPGRGPACTKHAPCYA